MHIEGTRVVERPTLSEHVMGWKGEQLDSQLVGIGISIGCLYNAPNIAGLSIVASPKLVCLLCWCMCMCSVSCQTAVWYNMSTGFCAACKHMYPQSSCSGVFGSLKGNTLACDMFDHASVWLSIGCSVTCCP